MDDLARPDLDLSRPRAGDLPIWARWLVLGAAVVTILIALAVPRLFLEADGLLAPAWVKLGLGGFVVVAMIAVAMARTPVSILARFAVMLPLSHLVLMLAVAVAWISLGARLEIAHSLVPLVDALPIGAIVGAVGAVILVAAWVIARRRRREVIQVAVTIALVQLLLLGAWLPLASHYAVDAFDFTHHWVKPAVLFETFHQPTALVAFALVPPLVAAVAYAAIATRRARWVPAMRMPLTIAFLVVLLTACLSRMGASASALAIYLNFVPWLLAAAFVAVAMIALLCGSFLISAAGRRRSIARGRRQFSGNVSGTATDIIACVAVRSWLRSPELVVDAFELETADGALPVPPGAILAASLPLGSTGLHVGEGLALLHGGTPVALAGFAPVDRPADGSPFRSSLAPTAAGGVIVGPEHQRDDGRLAQVVLAAWRPAVAYLLIFLAAAVPALAGLASSGR